MVRAITGGFACALLVGGAGCGCSQYEYGRREIPPMWTSNVFAASKVAHPSGRSCTGGGSAEPGEPEASPRNVESVHVLFYTLRGPICRG